MYKPNYTLTPEMFTAISEIAEIKSIVARSRVLPLNEAQLKRQAIIRMVHTSTSIEGNKLAEYQVDKVLSGMSVSADQRSIMEVKNYQEALKKIDDFVESDTKLTIEKILEFHKILMKDLLPSEKTGHFRPAEIYIIDELGDGREHLRYEGPDAKKVPFLVNELLLWLNDPDNKHLHPVIKAGIFHSHFVNIHPFSDGNGRMTRLLTTLILYKAGWDFRKILVLDDFYNRDRQEYYNALAEASGRKIEEELNLTPWLDYFLTGFLVEARKVNEHIQMIGFNKHPDTEEVVFLDKDEIKIMDFLTSTGQLTSDDVMEVLNIAKRTSQLKLKSLLKKGLIQVQGRGPATFYILKG